MSALPFVHLNVHSEFSLVDSTVRVAELVNRCAEDGMPAVALTDQMNLFGMVKFYKRALAAGVKPIVGADIRIVNEDDAARPFHLVLLCQNNDGYRKLSELLSRAYIEGQHRGDPLVNREWLNRESCLGLIALSGGVHGDVGHDLVLDHSDGASRRLEAWREIFDDR